MSQAGMPVASIVGSPIASVKNGKDDFSTDWISEERMEQSSSLFSQLDSMIAAVQSESSALDNMRNKVKELDTMKEAVANLNKRLLEADETNFAMKTALVRQQEQIAESRKAQSESVIVVAPLKAELQRTKDLFAKERQVRNKIMQENAALKEQGAQYELIIQQLQEQCSINSRLIPEQKEQIEQLRGELSRVRQQARGTNEKLVRKVKELQHNVPPAVVDSLKGEVRQLANRLLSVVGVSSVGDQHQCQSYQSSSSVSQFGHPQYGGYTSGGAHVQLETSYNPEDYDDESIYPELDDMHLDDVSEIGLGALGVGGTDINVSDIAGTSEYSSRNGNGNHSNSATNHDGGGYAKRRTSKSSLKPTVQTAAPMSEPMNPNFSLDAPVSLDHDDFEGDVATPAPSTLVAHKGNKQSKIQSGGGGSGGGHKKKKDKDKNSLPKI